MLTAVLSKRGGEIRSTRTACIPLRVDQLCVRLLLRAVTRVALLHLWEGWSAVVTVARSVARHLSVALAGAITLARACVAGGWPVNVFEHTLMPGLATVPLVKSDFVLVRLRVLVLRWTAAHRRLFILNRALQILLTLRLLLCTDQAVVD